MPHIHISIRAISMFHWIINLPGLPCCVYCSLPSLDYTRAHETETGKMFPSLQIIFVDFESIDAFCVKHLNAPIFAGNTIAFHFALFKFFFPVLHQQQIAEAKVTKDSVAIVEDQNESSRGQSSSRGGGLFTMVAGLGGGCALSWGYNEGYFTEIIVQLQDLISQLQ